MLILNLGCGDNKIEGAVNIDINPQLKPDVICDFTQGLPYDPNSVDKIYLFHVIEHLPKAAHNSILENISTVLKMDGLFFCSYPEFSVVADYWIKNHKGQRQFWEHTIYGRQSSPFDFHVSLMDSRTFVPFLREFGFDVETKTEKEEWNTICKCVKIQEPVTIESVYNKAWRLGGNKGSKGLH